MWAVFNGSQFSRPAPGRSKTSSCLEQQTAVKNKTAVGFLPASPVLDLWEVWLINTPSCQNKRVLQWAEGELVILPTPRISGGGLPSQPSQMQISAMIVGAFVDMKSDLTLVQLCSADTNCSLMLASWTGKKERKKINKEEQNIDKMENWCAQQ